MPSSSRLSSCLEVFTKLPSQKPRQGKGLLSWRETVQLTGPFTSS